MSDWSVYILRCADGTLYTGIARDPLKRLAEHNEGRAAARYTRARRPVALVYFEPAADRSAALKREYAIKRLSRAAKVKLTIEGLGESPEGIDTAAVEALSTPTPAPIGRRGS